MSGCTHGSSRLTQRPKSIDAMKVNEQCIGLTPFRKNPAAVLPGSDGVLVQPAPDGRIADAGHQSGLHGVAGDLRHAPPRQRHLLLTGQLTGQGFNLHHDFWGEKTGVDPIGGVPPSQAGVR